VQNHEDSTVFSRVNVAIAEAGSFRDPSGRVYEIDGEILRFVAPCAADDYDFVAASGVLETLAHRGWLVGTTEVDKTRLGAAGALIHRVVRHPRLAFVSYPYEWSFPLLLQLRRWIATLDPRDTGRTAFGDYEEGHSYGSDEESPSGVSSPSSARRSNRRSFGTSAHGSTVRAGHPTLAARQGLTRLGFSREIA
jgi:hypothetical protein